MIIITNENYDKLKGYVTHVDGVLDNMEGDVNLPLEAFEPQKYSYHMGAKHAFANVLDLVEVEQPKKTPVQTKGMAVLLTGVAVAVGYHSRTYVMAVFFMLKEKFIGGAVT